jgi:hypothetical protein
MMFLRRAAPLAAALGLWAAASFAQPVEVPVISVPVGTGISGSISAAGASVVASPGLAASMAAAPALAPTPALAPAAASAFVPLAAPAAAPALAAPAAAVPAAAAAPMAARAVARGPLGAAEAVGAPGAAPVFGRRESAPAAGESADAANDADWSRGAALFDLGAASKDGVSASATAGLPNNTTGKVLARLRAAGEKGLNAPGAIPGMAAVEWAGQVGGGYSAETEKVLIGGRPWFLKRLMASPDEVINALPRETRARNEVGFAAVLRGDPLLAESFKVAPSVSAFRDGSQVYVLSQGLPDVGDGESRRLELTPVQRADASIVQLVLGLGDMHGANVLPLAGGGFGLIDFEKLSRAPLEKATFHEIEDQVFMKNFPLVDRLSFNDPGVYRARFEVWRRSYEAGGRARMNRALAAAAWSRAERETYLAAVDRNAATYWERLEPYLNYASDWNARIKKARADEARAKAVEQKGFWSGLFGSGR